MEAKTIRKVRNGAAFNHYFPVAKLSENTIKKGATVSDTVQFIPKVVRETQAHTKQIAEYLKGQTLYETCSNIWHFVYNHIVYAKDKDGVEQIRSPARTWHDRFEGVDCDCYTTFISSILTNLRIPHTLRITKYKKNFFQHIYPIVPTSNNNYITIDCVVHKFDYEEPYSEKQDSKMDLNYLDGVDDDEFGNLENQNWQSADDLGRIRLFGKKKHDGGSSGGSGGGKGIKFFKKIGGAIKKGVHAINKVNPATTLLRLGILASMKVNLFKVASRIKYAYLSEADARAKGADMDKHAKLKKVLEKLEKIFFTAGGESSNLKKAILSGRGNRNNEVSGLGYYSSDDVDNFNQYTPLQSLLGFEMYQDETFESSNSIEGLGTLGEPATAATITAASGVIGTIASLIKAIGNLFPKKSSAGKEFEEGNDEKVPEGSDALTLPTESDSGSSESDSSSSDDGGGEKKKSNLPATTSKSKPDATDSSSEEDSGDGDKPPSFWEKNKKWLKPTGIAVGGLGLLAIGYKMFAKGNKSPNQANSVNGTPNSERVRRKPLKSKKKAHKPKTKLKSKKKKSIREVTI